MATSDSQNLHIVDVFVFAMSHSLGAYGSGIDGAKTQGNPWDVYKDRKCCL